MATVALAEVSPVPSPRTPDPQHQLRARPLGSVGNLAEQLLGMVLPGEGAGQVQLVANPAGVQPDTAGHHGHPGVVTLPVQDDVTPRTNVRRGAHQGGPLSLGRLLAAGDTGRLQILWDGEQRAG